MSTCCIIYCFKQRQFPLLDINISLGSPCCCHVVCQLMRQYIHVSRAYENCTTLQRKVRECSECPSVPEGTFIPVATQHFTKMEDKLA